MPIPLTISFSCSNPECGQTALNIVDYTETSLDDLDSLLPPGWKVIEDPTDNYGDPIGITCPNCEADVRPVFRKKGNKR